MAGNSSWPLYVQVLASVGSKGYVVQSYARIGRVGALLLLRPPLTFRVDGSAGAAELGAQIERALMAGAEQTGHVDKTQGFGSADYMRFLHVRSWRQLDREWRTLTVTDDGRRATVEELAFDPADKVPYDKLEEASPRLGLPASPGARALGEAVLSLLARKRPEVGGPGPRRVATLGGGTLEYDEPADCLEFLGDAHTDAYEAWGAPEGPGSGSVAAVMVDSGYDAEGSGSDRVDAGSVRAAWEGWFGPLRSFSHEEGPGGRIARADAVGADGTVVASRFLPDADGTPVEVTAQVRPDAPDGVREALLSVVSSARMAR